VSGPTVVPPVDEGLGNSTYRVDVGDGRGLVVDASRDLRTVRETAANPGLSVAYAADTHLHADFLSGASQLAAPDAWRRLVGYLLQACETKTAQPLPEPPTPRQIYGALKRLQPKPC
jgi:glyoxylase-like metal-dependent hydrolase (beta-lactamase superfamily II)